MAQNCISCPVYTVLAVSWSNVIQRIIKEQMDFQHDDEKLDCAVNGS